MLAAMSSITRLPVISRSMQAGEPRCPIATFTVSTKLAQLHCRCVDGDARRSEAPRLPATVSTRGGSDRLPPCFEDEAGLLQEGETRDAAI